MKIFAEAIKPLYIIKIKQVQIVAILLLFISLPALAQYKGKQLTDSGSIDGAVYKIDIPVNWNKKLVVYAHGYIGVNDPSYFTTSDNAVANIFLNKGFAFIRSAFRKKGLAIAEGVEDTETLRTYFEKKYGRPDSTFLTGHSMGGGVTLLIIENYAKHYQGVLALCPASSQYQQTRNAFDAIAVFNVMYPGTLPSLTKIMSGTADIIMPPIIEQKIKSDTVLAHRLADHYENSLRDAPFVLTFAQVLLKDIALQAGGNPFDNTNTLYTGYGFDFELNQKIERLSASSGSEEFLERQTPTGELSKPVVILHTVYDPLVAPSMAVVSYDNSVQKKGKERNLVVFYTDGQGHCNFTPEQISNAFKALRNWAATGNKPKAGVIR